jgi:hypothetical protein
MGQSGQSSRTEFQSKGSGEVKLTAICYAKKLKITYNASDPSVVRKQLIDLVASLHINLNGFDGPVPITALWTSTTTSKRTSRGSATQFATTILS